MTTPTYGDRVQETFTTTGTGTISLAGAVVGYQAFSAVVANAGTCYYGATDGTNWEIGLGTYATSGNTLARTTILASSNSGSAVNWAAGTKNIWLDFPAAIASLVANPNIEQLTPSNPTGTTSTSGVMMGIAGSITPKYSGTVYVAASGNIDNSSADPVLAFLAYGTGTAPTNGAASTGTGIGQVVEVNPGVAGTYYPWAAQGIITNLTVGTTYWLDINLSVATAGTGHIANISLSAFELK